MRVEQGWAEIKDRATGRVTAEFSVLTCAHCGGKIHAKTLRSHEFSRCPNCDDGKGRGVLCEGCIGSPCVSFMTKIEDAEAKARFRSMI